MHIFDIYTSVYKVSNVLTFRFPTMKSPVPITHGAKVRSENTTNVLFTPHCPLPRNNRVCRNSLAYLKIICLIITVDCPLLIYL